MKNKFREEKSYVICGRFFYRPWNVLEVHNCRPCGLRRSKSPPCWSYGWTPLPARRAHALASHFSLVVVGLVGRGASAVSGGTRHGYMVERFGSRNAPIRRLIQPANHDMFAMHKCRDHRRILSKHALDEFCWIFRMETPLLSLVCLDDARHEKSEPSRGADIVICHRCAQRRHAHLHAPKSLLHRGKHRPYTHRLVLHNAQSTTRHRQPNLMTNVVVHML